MLRQTESELKWYSLELTGYRPRLKFIGYLLQHARYCTEEAASTEKTFTEMILRALTQWSRTQRHGFLNATFEALVMYLSSEGDFPATPDYSIWPPYIQSGIRPRQGSHLLRAKNNNNFKILSQYQ